MPDFTALAPLSGARFLDGDARNGAALRLLPAAAQFVFRGPGETALLAGQAFGVALPNQACRAARAGDRAALWLGPDEWLLISPPDPAVQVETIIAGALGDTPYSIVGVGHRNFALQIEGPRAARVLNAGCPLNLDLEAFPDGMCTRTVLAKAQVVLWRTGPETFYIGVWRSFAPYVWDYLVEARARL